MGYSVKFSEFYLPIVKENPAQCGTLSHSLMIRSGMIRQHALGIYTLLPSCVRVLDKICKVIDEELSRIGCVKLLMPTIQPADIWKESGRYDSYGLEMLRIKDRHDSKLLYGPTNEEMIVDLVKKDFNLKNSLQMPLHLYHVQHKFRDEIRPRSGLMRCREFCMLDSYSLDSSQEESIATYYKTRSAFLNIFKRLNIDVACVKADSGAIGGNLNHEIHMISESGDSNVVMSKNKNDDVESFAVEDEDLKSFNSSEYEIKKGIEVGHTFHFHDKYSKSMNLSVQDYKTKNSIFPSMGSYGIGVTRTIASFIESNNDKDGIIWNKEMTPFDAIIVDCETESENERSLLGSKVAEILSKSQYSVFHHDKKSSYGQKMKDSDLIGFPIQIIIDKKNTNSDVVIRFRNDKSKSQVLDINNIINFINNNY